MAPPRSLEGDKLSNNIGPLEFQPKMERKVAGVEGTVLSIH
jgi:hypothetical protein